MAQFNVRLDPETIELIRSQAHRERTTMAAIIAAAIQTYASQGQASPASSDSTDGLAERLASIENRDAELRELLAELSKLPDQVASLAERLGKSKGSRR